MKATAGIILKSPRDIELMRQAGRLVALVLDKLARSLEPGMKTLELDRLTQQELKKYGAQASFLGYRGYPAHLCVSINDEVVHGIPGERVIQAGDIVSLDLGVIWEGLQADGAVTAGVGKVRPLAQRLMQATRDALWAGIAACRPGHRLGEASAAIQDLVESRGFSVVREYSGHGIGRELHEEPQIPNFRTPDLGPRLKSGMTLAIEPMVNAGSWLTRVAPNGWTVLSADGSLSAHFEHTIAITEGEAEVLTALVK